MSGSSRKRPDGIRPAAVIAVGLLLGACATPQSALLPELESWEQRKAILGELDEWQFGGRIAVKSDAKGFNGKLRWQQEEDSFRATVSGPINIGTVRIEGDGRTMMFTDSDGVRTELEDAEIELRYRYGWTIPVASLRFWALGIPDPSLPAETTVGDDGLLANLSQGGWAVSVSRYRDGGGQLMPSRLTAENADTRVRLVIDHWIFFD